MDIQAENLVSKTVRDLYNQVGFSFESFEVEKRKSQEGEDIFVIKIKSNDDCSFLLDDKGRNLKAFEYIARLLVIKELNQKVSLVIDLNNFLEKRNGKISELARLVAKKVQTTQKSFVLRPMSAFERRLVHLELAAWPDIVTESIGEEPKRRVVVKPHLA